MKRTWLLLGLSASIMWVTTAVGANRIVVESGSFAQGSTHAIAVYMENDVTLYGVCAPLVFRSTSNGAYPSAITAAYNPMGRLFSPGGPLNEIVVLAGYDSEDGACKSDQAGGFGTAEGYTDNGVSYTFASPDDPDAILYLRRRVFANWLDAGSDFPIGTGQPVFTFAVTLSSPAGEFEIDTTCINPVNHLSFELPSGSLVPEFTKGTIEVFACDCPHQADNWDKQLDANDLNFMIESLFFGGFNPQDPLCPTVRTDFNNDGFPDAVDVWAMVDYLFFNGPPPCDPCNPVQASCAP